MVIYNPLGICDDAVLWDVRYVLQGHDKYCISPFLSCFIIALTHAAKVFPKCCHPNFPSIRFVHEVLVATDELSGRGVNRGHSIMLEVDRWVWRWE